MYTLVNCNSCCLFLSASSRRNLRRFPFFYCSFSLSSSSLNHFVCKSAFLLKPVAKFAIAYICDLGVWHFSCGLKILFFAFSVRTFILIFLCPVLILSHEQQVKGFLLGIRFRLIHFPFLRLAFSHHSFYGRIPLKNSPLERRDLMHWKTGYQ